MSERSRYQRDRSFSRERREQSRGDRPHHCPPHHVPPAPPHYNQTNNRTDWNIRNSDNDPSFCTDQHQQDHQQGDQRVTSTTPSTLRYEHPVNSAPQEQDVWLREKQSRITYNDFDLRDVQFTETSDSARKLATYGAVLAMIGLIVFLGLSSVTPELSPEEIIAADGYEGEQPIKTPFNLASLHECEAGTECAEALKATVAPVVAATSQAETTPTTTVTTEDTTTLVATSIIVASNPATSPDNSGNSFSGSTSTESTIATQAISKSSSAANIYDRLTVLQQWSNVRGTPDINGDILVSLAIGKTVTKLGQSGPWIEVQVDERPAITGYMHRSTIAVQ